MQCANCGVEINHKFRFAIKQNKCPACGQEIMDNTRLATYISLTTLLKENTNIKDTDEVVNLIVANFEVKQLFNVAPKVEKPKPEVSEVVEEQEEMVVEEKPEDPDAEHKAKQIANAREQLKAMKKEAYEDALRSQYGMGDGEGGADLFTIGSDNMHMEREQKIEETRKKMLSGAGIVRRSE